MRKDRFESVILTVEGTEVAARVRTRTRKAISKARDLDRAAAREFARDREYA